MRGPSGGFLLMRGLVRMRVLVCVLLGAAGTLGPSHHLLAQSEADPARPSRSGLWVRAGLDFGVVRVDSAHSTSGGGGHIAAGWTLSPHWTIGPRAVINRSGSG